MKKKFIVPVRYVLILVLLPVGACHKFIDWKDVWHKHKPDCRIEKIIAKDFFSEEPLVADFTYNQKGDPLLVTFSVSGTGRPHLRFLYDNRGRLVGYVGPYDTDPNSGYEFYRLYQYDYKNRIKTDTTYGLGNIVNGVPIPNLQYRTYTDYEYDAYDRISKLTIFAIVSGLPVFVWTEEFSYNADGNLSLYRNIRPGDTTESNLGPYDNKININMTNKVWMFINHDYSRNNAQPATAYNKSKLPTRFQLVYPQGLGFLYQFDISDSEIFYDCKK